MEHGIPDSREATEQAIKDVGSSLIAITLMFLAIFVLVAVMWHHKEDIQVVWRHDVFTVVCSTFMAFTLSPAMCAYLLANIKLKTRGPLLWFNKPLKLCSGCFVRASMLLAINFIVLMLCFIASCAVLGTL